ncbi:MAG: virulence RhuM family protein [Bacteroidales bacterium]|nr:virulence RhuM family protein [Bacteroidales bacterium]
MQLFFDGETVWTTQKRIAVIFQVEVTTVNYHLKKIFDSGELNRYSVIRKDWITAADGKSYETMLYNLDVIIAVGYRVNSYKATRFRQWVTITLSQYVKNGYVLDSDRFIHGNQLTYIKFEQHHEVGCGDCQELSVRGTYARVEPNRRGLHQLGRNTSKESSSNMG